MAYIGHFCIQEKRTKRRNLPIENNQKTLDGFTSTHFPNTYKFLFFIGVFTLGVLFFVIIFLRPGTASAFWPISFLQASEDGLVQPVLHDETLPLLRAANNSDPNPNKGDFEIALSGDTSLLAQAGPEGALSEVVHAPRAGQISVYVVREGDALSEIASMFGVTVNTILWANDIKKASLIAPGDTLIILPVNGVRHTVKKGDTLKSIAKKYDGDVDDIASYNGIESGVALAVGEEIIIPGGEVSAPAAPKIAKSAGGSAGAQPVSSAGSGLFGNPLPGSRITQGLHGYNGVDFGAPYGTPIVAAASGNVIVSRSGGYNGGYGSYVVIDHGNGAQTLYAHMSSVASSVGDYVSKGDVIGYVGSTGRSTGNHLHFEVRGGYRNPFAY